MGIEEWENEKTIIVSSEQAKVGRTLHHAVDHLMYRAVSTGDDQQRITVQHRVQHCCA